MKKIVNKLKQNAKIITAFVLGAILTGGTVYAATVLPSSQVGYDNSTSGLAATDVQGAIDELYTRSQTWIAPMQNFDKSSLVNTGDTAKIYDARDDSVYIVKKLADGNVWMTQNLRITNKTLTPADSNITSNFTIPVSSISGFSAQDTNNAYVDSIHGGYYTFYTATAGTGGSGLTSGNAPSDICPKGWRLPTKSEFDTLANNYNSLALIQGEPGIIYTDSIHNGSFSGNQGAGYYHTSTVDGSTKAYYLYVSGSSIHARNSAGKYYGKPVRCIAK